MFEAASLHAELTTAPLDYAIPDGKVWTNGPCYETGSLQASLNGVVSPPAGTSLPTGSHTYAVSFANCVVDGLVGVVLTGAASVAYNTADWSNITATVSANSLRGAGLYSGQSSRLSDVTADGSAVLTRAGWWTFSGSSTRTSTYTPAVGSRLVNNTTANVATFGGGSYSNIFVPGLQGASNRVEERFDNLRVAISGTEYAISGSLATTHGKNGSATTYTGEIRITNNGTLVARIYGDARNALAIEVLVPLVSL